MLRSFSSFLYDKIMEDISKYVSPEKAVLIIRDAFHYIRVPRDLSTLDLMLKKGDIEKMYEMSNKEYLEILKRVLNILKKKENVELGKTYLRCLNEVLNNLLKMSEEKLINFCEKYFIKKLERTTPLTWLLSTLNDMVSMTGYTPSKKEFEELLEKILKLSKPTLYAFLRYLAKDSLVPGPKEAVITRNGIYLVPNALAPKDLEELNEIWSKIKEKIEKMDDRTADYILSRLILIYNPFDPKSIWYCVREILNAEPMSRAPKYEELLKEWKGFRKNFLYDLKEVEKYLIKQCLEQ